MAELELAVYTLCLAMVSSDPTTEKATKSKVWGMKSWRNSNIWIITRYQELVEVDESFNDIMKTAADYAKGVVVKIGNAKVAIEAYAATPNIESIRVRLTSLSTYQYK